MWKWLWYITFAGVLISCSRPADIPAPTAKPVLPASTATMPPPPTATMPPPPTATMPPPPTATSVPELCRERPVGTGKAPGTNDLMPGGTRLRVARSDELKHWIIDDGFILDQAATPSLTLSPDGMPMLYMTAHAINGKRDGFAVSIGDAEARSWRHCFVNLINFPPWLGGSDPDVVRIAEGQYRIFLTGSVAEGKKTIGIHYADSTDGITWTYGGLAFAPADSVIDSMTFRLGDTWHMYVLTMQGIDMVHATSSDGKTFMQESQAKRLITNKPHVLSQTLVLDDNPDQPSAMVFGFGFEAPGTYISMSSTADGATLEDVANINPIITMGEGDSHFVKDPAIVYLGRESGSTYPYIMVYSTAIP